MTLLKECVSIISLNLNQRFSRYPQNMENTYDRTLFCNCITNHNNNEEDEVIVSIKDTGIEIHPPILPKLFTKFVSASPKGTGLGCISVRVLLKLMVARFGLRTMLMATEPLLCLVCRSIRIYYKTYPLFFLFL